MKELLEFLEVKVDNALRLCYNDSRATAVDVLLDLKNDLKEAKEMIQDEQELAEVL